MAYALTHPLLTIDDDGRFTYPFNPSFGRHFDSQMAHVRRNDGIWGVRIA